jgi:predicted nucleic acid-binding protein
VIVFIDSNIPMYAAGREHAYRDSSRQFLAAVHRGEIEGCTSTEVLQEILYRYSSLQRLDLGCEVYDLFTAICPNVLDVTLADTDLALDLLREGRGLSARDAIHAAVMANHDIEWIATFDADFDRVSGVRRFALA